MSPPLSVLFCLFHCFLLAKTIKFARYLVQFLACSHYICSGIGNQLILISCSRRTTFRRFFPDYYTSRWYLTNSNCSRSLVRNKKHASKKYLRVTWL